MLVKLDTEILKTVDQFFMKIIHHKCRKIHNDLIDLVNILSRSDYHCLSLYQAALPGLEAIRYLALLRTFQFAVKSFNKILNDLGGEELYMLVL